MRPGSGRKAGKRGGADQAEEKPGKRGGADRAEGKAGKQGGADQAEEKSGKRGGADRAEGKVCRQLCGGGEDKQNLRFVEHGEEWN